MVDASTFCLTRTHTFHCDPKIRVFGVYLLEKTYRRSLFVQSHDRTARTSPSTFPFLPSSQCQRADPGYLFRERRHGSSRFLIFGNRMFTSGCPAAHLPFQRSSPPRPAGPFVSNEAGYRGGRFCCQHPKMTKPTKSEIIGPAFKKPRRAGPFFPPRQCA